MRAQDLAECCDPQGSAFGHLVRTALDDLMETIYATREGPPEPLREALTERRAGRPLTPLPAPGV